MRLNELLAYGDIAVQCHDFPDADALASGFGVYLYLKAHGKEPRLIYSGTKEITKPNLLHMISQLEIPIEYTPAPGSHEALVTVDCCYGEGNVTGAPSENIFVIDHHTFTASCPYRNEIRSSYSSCSTVVAQLLREDGFDYNENRNLATALYYGLYSDTNGMNEINHPADRDLRDLTKFDELTVNLLKNSNLSLEEMKIAGDALKHYKFSGEYGFAVVEAMPCDPNILGFICDLLLQVDRVNTCVVFCRRLLGVKLSVRSCISDIRANELAQYIVKDMGNGGGHARKAGGYLSPPTECESVSELIYGRMECYHSSYEIIRAGEYKADIAAMTKYRKKPFLVGYVKSTELLDAGTEMCIRTLEADLNVCADDDLYVMVGIRGEVYPIRREKFERSYTPVDGKFTPQTDYVPSLIEKDSFCSIDLLPYVRTCICSGISCIYASELKKTVKVYTAWDKSSYLLGRAGDYLAVRADDLNDVYIIEGNIFLQTYLEAEE